MWQALLCIVCVCCRLLVVGPPAVCGCLAAPGMCCPSALSWLTAAAPSACLQVVVAWNPESLYAMLGERVRVTMETPGIRVASRRLLQPGFTHEALAGYIGKVRHAAGQHARGRCAAVGVSVIESV